MNKTWQDNYKEWINHPKVPQSLKTRAQEMDNAEKEVAFAPTPFQFGTAGYRAKMGPGTKYLNGITYSQLAYGYGMFLKQKGLANQPVIVIHDNRLNGDKFAMIVANVLSSLGITVLLMPNNTVMSTPILSYMIINLHAAGGVNITASHNPKEYNGFKCYNHFGSQLLPEDDEIVLSYIPSWEEILNQEFIPDGLKIQALDPKIIDDYFAAVKKTLKHTDPNVKKDLKFLFSPMHGSSAPYMPKFLESLGYECVCFEPQMSIDPDFPNTKIINPEEEHSFDLAIEYANEHNIDLILACDPDADRLGVAFKKNNKWEFLNGNAAGIIETYYLLKNLEPQANKLPVVVSTYVTNNLIDFIAKKYNARVVRVPTGFKWIADVANHIGVNEEFIIGFEEAIGSLPSNINREKDSYQVAGLLLEILYSYKDQGYDFYDILEHEIYPEFGHWYGKTFFRIIQGNQWKELAKKYLNQVLNFPHNSILTREIVSIDENKFAGTVTFNFENESWLKFRISGTEPKFKMYFNLYKSPIEHEYDPRSTISLHEEAEDIAEFISQYLGI